MRGREEGIRKREDGKEHMHYRLQNKDINSSNRGFETRFYMNNDIRKEGRKKEEVRHFLRLSHDIVCT